MSQKPRVLRKKRRRQKGLCVMMRMEILFRVKSGHWGRMASRFHGLCVMMRMEILFHGASGHLGPMASLCHGASGHLDRTVSLCRVHQNWMQTASPFRGQIDLPDRIDRHVKAAAGRTGRQEAIDRTGHQGLVQTASPFREVTVPPFVVIGPKETAIDRLLGAIGLGRRAAGKAVHRVATDGPRARATKGNAQVVAVVVPVVATDRNFAVAISPPFVQVFHRAAVVAEAVRVAEVLVARARLATKSSKPQTSMVAVKSLRHPARKIGARTVLVTTARKKCSRGKMWQKFR
jgi:hypothetical protein